MIRKLVIVILILIYGVPSVVAQVRPDRLGNVDSYRAYGDTLTGTQRDSLQKEQNKELAKKKKVPSIIRIWNLNDFGSSFVEQELDTALVFFHNYNPINQRSFSNTFTGNFGGAYLSNDFFSRDAVSDFYFNRSFDAYGQFPETARYWNTTTPYTLLDYSQSENKSNRNETRFNVFHSRNTNRKFNFILLYDQAKSTGHYNFQETKFHNIGLLTSYISDKYLSHFYLMFNRYKAQENGGLEPGQDLTKLSETEAYVVNLTAANSEIHNNSFSFTNEYRLGRKIEKEDKEGYLYDAFQPITGVIHQIEYSGNTRYYSDTDTAAIGFYPNIFFSKITNDTVIFNRLTNIVQLMFYETPNRKFTFTPRGFIGYDIVSVKKPSTDVNILQKTNYQNLFVGGAISRTQGEFWKWNAEAKIYLTGFKSGQTEISGYIYKPLRIRKDTTSLYIAAELNTLVPDYFVEEFNSNHYQWTNDFNNTTEVRIKSKIDLQKYNFTVGVNYALISNYIYNDSEAIPRQGSREMMVLGAYANKDFVSRHWHIRLQGLWQKATEADYLHLPDLAAYMSLNYRTLISKVLHAQLGFDVRYNTEFNADAFEPATGRFHWQNEQNIGNYPFIDLHASLKLKRTRAFFLLKNAGAKLIDGQFWAAPNYPLYRRTFRLGIAWSFYD